MTTSRRWPVYLALALLVAVPVAARADYVCPDGRSYLTTCGPADNHARCIRAQSGLGCCNPGNCNTSGVCVIDTNSNVCPDDSDPCTKATCTTGGAGGFDPVCGQAADPLKAGTDCSNVDGDKCTIDKCNSSGVCTFDHNKVDDCNLPATDPQCPDTKSCHSPDGACVVTYTNQNASCNDGFDCTVGEVCINGTCKNGAIQPQGTVCSDGNVCHTGFCQGGNSKQCVNITNVPNGTVCGSTSNPCVDAACASGSCTGTVNKSDGTSCTTDTNSCTIQTCASGTCTVTSCAVDPVVCDFCNPPSACTTDLPTCGCANK